LEAWAADNVAWLREEHGANLVQVVLHLDERTPHLHAAVVPGHRAGGRGGPRGWGGGGGRGGGPGGGPRRPCRHHRSSTSTATWRRHRWWRCRAKAMSWSPSW
ncbi:plasmid recombination protein, partial [Stenotrophomonas maltophilia]|nr:plasmid recombination protein [Stenotrophomonas maltophilia]